MTKARATAKGITGPATASIHLFAQPNEEWRPPTLAEELKLAKQAAAGDGAARDELATRYVGFVVLCAHQAMPTGVVTRSRRSLADELISVATIGLMKAINAYNLQSGKPLTEQAKPKIDRQIRLHLKRQKVIGQQDILSIEEMGEEGEALLARHQRATAKQSASKDNQVALVWSVLAAAPLTKMEKALYVARVLPEGDEPTPYTTLAATYGKPVGEIKAIVRRAANKFAKQLRYYAATETLRRG